MSSVPAVKPQRIILSLTIALMVLFTWAGAGIATAAEVTLACDPSPDQNIVGYRIYYRTDTAGPPYLGAGLDQGASPVEVPLSTLQDPSAPEFSLSGLTSGTYYFACTVYDGQDNESGYSNEVRYTVTDDSQPPGTPIDITAVGLDANRILLSWTAVGSPAGYRIYRDGHLVGTTGDATFIDTGLLAANDYAYTIAALDEADNPSAPSEPVSARTLMASDFSLRINCGGGSYLDSAGHQWQPDTGYTGGFISGTEDPIHGIVDDALLCAVRYEDAPGGQLAYSFEVPNGSYQVNLYYADIYPGTAGIGERIFDTVIEGQRVTDDLDIYAQVGHDTALIHTFETTVSDGELNLAFLSQYRRAVIGAIEVLGTGVTAPAPPPQYTVTATAGANGTISPAGPSTVISGGSISYDIMPAAHHHVANVYVDGTSVGPVNAYHFDQITADHTIRAEFALNRYTVTAEAGSGGSIAPQGTTTVGHGEALTLQITPAAHYEVADLFVNGVSLGAVSQHTLTNISAETRVAASFKADTHVVSASATGSGRISPAGATEVTCGAAVTYRFTPDAHHHVENVTVDGVSMGALATYTLDQIHTDHTISVDFARDEFTVTTAAGDHGTILPAGPIEAAYGSALTFSIQPAAGYVVADVLVDGISVGAVDTHRLSSVQGDHHIAASFEPEVVHAPIFESGELSVDQTWVPVTFERTYNEPIVVARSLSNNSADPAVVRVRHVSASGFEIRVQEWDYGDGQHLPERVGYLVMERGTYTLADGTRIEASTLDTSTTHAFEPILFERAFNRIPVVIAAVASANEADAVTGRMHSVDTEGFHYGMREQERNSQSHAMEAIAYIAWEPSTGEIDGRRFHVDRTGNTVTHEPHLIDFAGVFSSAPVFLADMQTADGSDCANLRWQDKTADTVAVHVAEEQSHDDEVAHTSEVVGFIGVAMPDTAEPDGPVTGDTLRIDNRDEGFAIVGNWGASAFTEGYYGSDYRYAAAGAGSRLASWSFPVVAGQYAISARWTAHHNRASLARYRVFNNGIEIGYQDCDQTLNGGIFNPFETPFAVSAGTLEVLLSDDADGYVIADAVQIEFLGAGGEGSDTVDFEAQIIDNRDAQFSVEGGWSASTFIPGYFLDDYLHAAAGGGELRASWTFNVPPGTYSLSVQWAAHANRAAHATYRMFNNATLIGTAVMDQRTDGGRFNSLGNYTVTGGTLTVVLDNDADGYVVADAVKLDRALP